MLTLRELLIAVVMLGASIWVGGLMCLALVSSVAARVLDGTSRVALFRGIGRRYGVLGSGSLIVAMAGALTLTWPPSRLAAAGIGMIVLSGALIVATAVGMVQARRMTVRRRRALATPDNTQMARLVHRGSIVAGALRGVIGVLTLGILLTSAHLLAR